MTRPSRGIFIFPSDPYRGISRRVPADRSPATNPAGLHISDVLLLHSSSARDAAAVTWSPPGSRPRDDKSGRREEKIPQAKSPHETQVSSSPVSFRDLHQLEELGSLSCRIWLCSAK
jgi:hypothetical protein